MSRIRTSWTVSVAPKCFPSLEDWREWYAMRGDSGAHPCRDCMPQYRRQMCNALRCERPEVVFVLHQETLEYEGVTAEDPRYARILMGMAPGGRYELVGDGVPYTATWARLLELVMPRAHRAVQRAIRIWLKRFEQVGR